jgi:hypothetical protein
VHYTPSDRAASRVGNEPGDLLPNDLHLLNVDQWKLEQCDRAPYPFNSMFFMLAGERGS